MMDYALLGLILCGVLVLIGLIAYLVNRQAERDDRQSGKDDGKSSDNDKKLFGIF